MDLYFDIPCRVVCRAHIDVALSSRSCRQKEYDREQPAVCNEAFRTAGFTFATLADSVINQNTVSR